LSDWTVSDLLPGLYVFLLGAGLATVLRRWYDAVPWHILAVFGVILVLLLGTVLFGGGVLLPLGNLPGFLPFRQLPFPDPPSLALQGDLVHQITPWTVEVRRAFREGRWPLWNVRAGAGMPLLADPQAQVLQPFVMLACPFPITAAVGVTAALRLLFALVFTFLLLRRLGLGEAAALAGSLAFGLGGFLMLWLGWPLASCAAWLPVVLYGLARCDREEGSSTRDLILLFGATTGLMLGGHPEVMLYALGLVGLFLLDRARRRGGAVGRRLLARCGLTLALAGTVASPMLLPALDYLPTTERAAVVMATLPPISLSELWRELRKPETLESWRTRSVQRLLPVVAPRAYGDHNYYWGSGNVIDDASGFPGSAALLAALVALLPLRGRRRFPQERVILLALIAALLLMVQPPGIDRLFVRLPIVGATFVRQSHRILILISFCLAALAACETGRRSRGEGARWPVLVAAAALAALLIWGYQAHPNPQDPTLLADYRSRMLAVHLVTLALTAVLLMLRPQGRKWGRAVPWLFCGLVAGELLLIHGPALPPAPRRLAWPVTPPMRFLQENLGDFRMMGLGKDVLPANFALVYGLNDVRIDNPSLPQAYGETVWPLRRQPPDHLFARPGHPMYDLLGVRYVLTEPGVVLPLRLVFQDPTMWIYWRRGALPRLFLPARAIAYRGGGPWWWWLGANRDFAKRALVQASPDLGDVWWASSPKASSLVVAIPEPERVHARASLAEPRLLASSVLQDGNWHLLAEGKWRPTVIADGPFVAAWLPAGEQRVDLIYRPGRFVAGLVFAALALAAAAAWWVPRPQKSDRSDRSDRSVGSAVS
jgi:Bacterial membrane protein YfhO